MAMLVAVYKTPKSADAFARHYSSTHAPLAKKIPGLRKYEISQGAVGTPAGPSGYHLVAILHFDDVPAIQAAFASPGGKAALDDLPNFATGGADVFMFESRDA